jgi:hypothetical protein
MGIVQTIERRLILTFHLVESIIPRFGGVRTLPDGKREATPLLQLQPAIELSLHARSALIPRRGFGRDQQSHRKHLETQRYRGAPCRSHAEKLLRLARWEGTLSPLIVMITRRGTGPHAEWFVLPCETRH